MVECLTRDRRMSGLRVTGGTVLSLLLLLLSYSSSEQIMRCPNYAGANVIYKLVNYKTSMLKLAHSKDSDQPGLPPSLFRVFAIRMHTP